MSDIKKTQDGWSIGTQYGDSHIEELSFIADLKHGLALLPGTLNDVLEKIARIHKKIDKSEHSMVISVSLGDEVDEMEATYMLETCLLPRRVLIRLRD